MRVLCLGVHKESDYGNERVVWCCQEQYKRILMGLGATEREVDLIINGAKADLERIEARLNNTDWTDYAKALNSEE